MTTWSQIHLDIHVDVCVTPQPGIRYQHLSERTYKHTTHLEVLANATSTMALSSTYAFQRDQLCALVQSIAANVLVRADREHDAFNGLLELTRGGP